MACAAPFVTLEFGAYGLVQACCANALYPLGDIRTQSIDEIWAVQDKLAILFSQTSFDEVAPQPSLPVSAVSPEDVARSREAQR